MVYFVKCVTQVYCTQIDCVPSGFSEPLNDITDRVYSMITTYPFFETKLVVISLEKFGEFLLDSIQIISR